MKRPKFVFVGGINGSGKTTILDLIANNNKEIELIKGSSFFMKWLKIKQGDYERLQSMPDQRILRELGKMMKYIINKRRFDRSKKVVLIDAHFLNIRHGRAQEWVNNWLSLMDALILIKSAPKEILKRLEADENKSVKKRGIFAINTSHKRRLELIRIFNKRSERVFKRYAKMYNKPNKMLINENGRPSKSAKELKQFITSI